MPNTNLTSSSKISQQCSLHSPHSHRLLLLQFDETAFNVPQHRLIAAKKKKRKKKRIEINNRVSFTIRYQNELINRERGSYTRARPLYACVTCWSRAESCMTSADSASALLCSFATWPYGQSRTDQQKFQTVSITKLEFRVAKANNEA